MPRSVLLIEAGERWEAAAYGEAKTAKKKKKKKKIQPHLTYHGGRCVNLGFGPSIFQTSKAKEKSGNQATPFRTMCLMMRPCDRRVQSFSIDFRDILRTVQGRSRSEVRSISGKFFPCRPSRSCRCQGRRRRVETLID